MESGLKRLYIMVCGIAAALLLAFPQVAFAEPGDESTDGDSRYAQLDGTGGDPDGADDSEGSDDLEDPVDLVEPVGSDGLEDTEDLDDADGADGADDAEPTDGELSAQAVVARADAEAERGADEPADESDAEQPAEPIVVQVVQTTAPRAPSASLSVLAHVQNIGWG